MEDGDGSGGDGIGQRREDDQPGGEDIRFYVSYNKSGLVNLMFFY